MKIQKGIVKYKDRNDIVCTYGVTDDGRQYYFLDETDSKKFANGNRIATTALVEAVDPMVKASNVGVIDNDGNVIIMFDNRCVKPISDNIILVEKANPISQSVIDALNLRSDPLSATKLVSTPATIKERLNAQMGSEGRYIFNDQFSEATLYDINGNNLLNGEYYSFMAIANGKIYMSKNTVDSVINEMPLDSTNEQAIDVSAVSVDQSVIEGALQQDVNAVSVDTVGDTSVQNNFSEPVSGVDNVVVDNAANDNVSSEVVADEMSVQNQNPMSDVAVENSNVNTITQDNYPIPADAVDSVPPAPIYSAPAVEEVSSDAVAIGSSLENTIVDGVENGLGTVQEGFESVSVSDGQNGFTPDEIASDIMNNDSMVSENQEFVADGNNMIDTPVAEDVSVDNAVEVPVTENVVVDVQASDSISGENNNFGVADDIVASAEVPVGVSVPIEAAVGEENVTAEADTDLSSDISKEGNESIENVENNEVTEEVPEDNVGLDDSQNALIANDLVSSPDTQEDSEVSEDEVKEEESKEEASEVQDSMTDVNIDMPPVVEENEEAETENHDENNEKVDSEDTEKAPDDVSESVVEESHETVAEEEVPEKEDEDVQESTEENSEVETYEETAVDSNDSDFDFESKTNVENEEDTALNDVRFNDSFDDVIESRSRDKDDLERRDYSSFNNTSFENKNEYIGNSLSSIERTYYDRDPIDYSIPVRGNNQYSMYNENYDSVFKSTMVKPDRIAMPYNSFGGYNNPQSDSSSIMSDVARSMAELMRQNKEQRGTILQYQQKLEEVEAQRRVISDKYNDQTLRVESLSSKLRSIDDASSRLENKNQMLENRLREQEKIIAAQERELNVLRPQLEGRQDLIKILADAKALLGSEEEYQEDSYYGRRAA